MANTRELAQFASFVDFTGSSIGFSTQFTVSGISTFTDKVIFDSTNSIQIPVGTEGQKESVGTAVTGQIRFNSTNQQFEGFGAGNNWGPLGGVKDVDGDTLISAESSAGADEDKLEFITANSTRVAIDSTGKVGIGSTIPTVTLDVVGNAKISGVLTATTFSGTLATSDLSGNVTDSQLTEDYIKTSEVDDSSIEFSGDSLNVKASGITNAMLGGSIANDKLSNSSVSFGGVSVALGAADATPAFDLQDATGYPFTSLTGITTVISGDTTPTLGGNLDANSNDISGIGSLSVTGFATISSSARISGASVTLDNSASYGDLSYSPQLFFKNNSSNNNFYIWKDGSTNLIEAQGSDDLIIRSRDESGDILIQSRTNEYGIKVLDAAAVELYYNNSKKFETTGIGVSILSGAGLTATIAGPPNLVIDPGTVGDNTGNVRIKGDLFVDGTTTQINSTALEISDFIVGIATTATTDALADGAGIQIGPSGNTFLYDNTNEAFTSTENLNVASGHTYKIAGTDVLSNDTLGSNVVNSSLTSVGSLSDLTVSGVTTSNAFVVAEDNAIHFRGTAGNDFDAILRQQADGGHLLINSRHIARINIDANSDSTDAYFAVGKDAATSGSTELFRVQEDGTVGIGTSNPSAKLNIVGSDSQLLNLIQDSGDLQIRLNDRGTGSAYIKVPDNTSGSLTFETGGSERLRINSDGYIGINETSPIHHLSIGINTSTAWDSTKNISNTTNNDFIGLNIGNKNSSDNPEIGIMLQAGASGSGQYTINCLRTGTNTADLIFRTRNGGAASKEVLRITSAGSVGIGTDNPAQKLDVIGGNIRVGKTSNGQFIGENNSGTVKIKLDTDGNSHLSGGNVGIGTDNPQRKLVVSDNGTEGLEFFPGDSANGSTINAYNRATAAFTPFSLNAQDYRFSPNGGAEAVRIISTGLVGIGTSNPLVKLHLHDSTNTRIQFTDDSVGGAADDGVIMGLNGDDDFFINNRESSKNLLLFTENAERLRISSDGQIGIGTTGTSALLTIGGDSNAVTAPSIRLLDGTDTREVSITNASGDFIVSTHGADDAIHGQIKIFESGIIDFDNGGASDTLTNRLRITSDGKISQGGHTPSYEYDLRGNGLQSILVGSEDSNGAMLILDGDSNGDGSGTDYASILHGSDGNIEINNRKSAAIIFKNTSDETERFRITSGGELVSTNGTLRRDASDSSFTVSGDTASNTGANINLYGAGHASLANVFRVRTGSSERLRVSGTGNLEIGTVVDAGDGLRNVDIQNIHTGSSAGAIMRLITSQSDGSGTTSVDFVKYKTGGLFIANNENNGTTGFIAFNTAENGGSTTERLRITSGGDLKRSKSLSQEVSTSVSSTSATSCGSFAKATYRSAYVIAQITQGSSYQVGRYLVIHDGTTATTIEESAIATGDMLGTFSGVVSGSNVEFRVTMSSASSATVITKIESIVV